jgi:hypothetical protein
MIRATTCLGSLVLILVLAWAQPSRALQNEPLNCRGIAWGEEFDNLEGLIKITTESRLDYYTKKDEEMILGDAPMEKVTYVFYHKKLCGAVLNFTSSLNFQLVKTTLFDLHGEGDQSKINEDRYRWSGTDVMITLEYNDVTQKGKVTYYYLPLHVKKQRADQRRKRLSSRGS